MLTGKKLNYMPLVTMKDGRKIGEIKDLYLDANARQVAAIFVGKEGLLGRKTQVIERARIQVFGVDVWLVTDADAVAILSDVRDSEGFLFMGDLRGRELHTAGGTRIGTVGDVILDQEARVRGFTLGRVYVQGSLAEKKSIARDAITDLGDDERPMIVDMPRAEMLQMPD